MEKIGDVEQLKGIAKAVRKDIIEMVYSAGSGHPGGSLSAADMLTVLFFSVMEHDPQKPKDENRDRFILSKGHATPVYYSILSRAGYLPHEELSTFRQLGSRLQGHPDKSKFDLMESTSGSLGQGLSIAAGMAFALRLENKPSRTYCLLGDGELDEGQIWEALATIKKYNLTNLLPIIDNNKIQLDGTNKDVKDLEPLNSKLAAFGYNVIEIDGHDINALLDAFKNIDYSKNNIMLCHTVKGKGVSFMENTPEWHGKAPNKEQYEAAMRELE